MGRLKWKREPTATEEAENRLQQPPQPFHPSVKMPAEPMSIVNVFPAVIVTLDP